MCRLGFLHPARLAGAADDPHLSWLDEADGSRHEVAWPAGYVATFEPLLAVKRPDGTIVGRAGDAVGGGCPTAESGVWYVLDGNYALIAPTP